MKIPPTCPTPAGRTRRSNGERGTITLVFVILLAIMMILVTAEGSALWRLHRDVKSLEQQQIKRLNHSGPVTPSTNP